MPLITLTLDDQLDAVGAPHDNIALEEQPVECDGRKCGSRPDLENEKGESLENTLEYISLYGSGPVSEHSHILSSRNHPGARRYYTKVF